MKHTEGQIPMKKSISIFLLASITPVTLSNAANRIDCAVCEVGVTSDTTIGMSSEIAILNCSVITSASGSASGSAVESTIDYVSKHPSCFPELPRTVSLFGGVTAADADVDIMVDRHMSVGGGAGSGHFSFVADLGSNHPGGCRIATSVGGRHFVQSVGISQAFFPFAQLGNSYVGVFGSGGAGGDVSITTSEPLQLRIVVSSDTTSTWIPIIECDELPFAEGSSTEVELLSGIYYKAVADGVVCVTGLIATQPDTAAVRLGIFADPGFEEQTTSDSTSLIGSATTFVTASGSGSISISDSWESYAVAMGDIDGDGYITFCDRGLLMLMNGATMGDPVYDPRGDMDIDGDIDADDIARAELVFEVAILNYECLGDYTGDGVLNFSDLSEFLSDFQNQVPAADFDCNGTFNFSDISGFMVEYSAGCN